MTIRVTIFLQLLGLFLQVMVPAVVSVWPETKPFESLARAMVSFLQSAQGILAHTYSLEGKRLAKGNPPSNSPSRDQFDSSFWTSR